MANSSSIRSVWEAQVFEQSSITTLTDKHYFYDLASITEESTAHDALTRYNQAINFFQVQVIKSRTILLSGSQETLFHVTIQYYKEADKAGAAYNAIEDAFETIADLVRSNSAMGDTWGGNVDYYTLQEGAPAMTALTINGVSCWMGEYEFIGHSIESI